MLAGSDRNQKPSLEMVDERFFIVMSFLAVCAQYFCQILRWSGGTWNNEQLRHLHTTLGTSYTRFLKKDRTHLQEQEDGFHKEAVPSFLYRHVAWRSAIFVGSLDWRIARTSNIFTDTWPFVSARQNVIWFFILTLLGWIFFLCLCGLWWDFVVSVH